MKILVPTPVEDYIEDRIDLSEYLTPKPENALLIRIEGDIPDAGIQSGDLLIAERRTSAKSGDLIISRVGEQFTVEHFHGRGPLSLVSDIPPQEPIVRAVVRFVIHRL